MFWYVKIWLILFLCAMPIGCMSKLHFGYVPLLAADRDALNKETSILVYGESEAARGLPVGSTYWGTAGIRIRWHGALGLVQAPRIREGIIEHIRSSMELNNFVLVDAPLSRDMSEVDPLSQDAIHHSAYRGIYLVFRSGWRLIDDDPRLFGPSGLHFRVEGVLVRPTEAEDEIEWRDTCHIIATHPPFQPEPDETGSDWMRRLNTRQHSVIQEVGQRLADYCADHLARSFIGQAPPTRPTKTYLLSSERAARPSYYWSN
jgi:hypothetical protein